MACLRGVPLGEPPPTGTITEAEVVAKLEAMDTAGPPHPHGDTALRLLLLRPGTTNAEADALARKQYAATLGAYYDDVTKSVTLVQHPTPFDPAVAQELLAHEYVHAQQDAEHDLGAYAKSHETSTDARLGVLSVVEGEALLYEQLFVLHQAGADPARAGWTEFFSRLEGEVEADTSDEKKPVDDALDLFPYAWGGDRAYRAWASAGVPAVRKLFDAPPATANGLLDPAFGLGPGQSFDDPTTVPTAFTRESADSLGALAFGAFFARTHQLGVSPDPCGSVSTYPTSAWRGDRMDVFGDDATGATVLVWRVQLADATTATWAACELGPKTPLPAGASWHSRADGGLVTLVVTDAPEALQPWLDAMGP